MKNRLVIIYFVLASVLIVTFIVWFFSLHGTRGLLHVEKIFCVAIAVLALLGIAPPFLYLVGWLKRHKGRIRTGLNISVIVISSISIATIAIACFYINGFPSPPVTDAPRLVLVAGSGTNGIPDVAVVAKSQKPSQYTLDWYKVGDPARTNMESVKSVAHTFILDNLTPASEYRYRINTGVEYHFHTPDTSGSLHFAIGSDAHFGAGDNRPGLTAQMLAQIADPANGFDYFFSLGDMVEYGFRVEQWQEALTALSTTVSSVPTVFVAGNHDTLFTGVDRFLEYCYPDGVETKTGSPLWYRFDVENIHFLVLDLEWSAETFTTRQQPWLENELKSIPLDDWTIVMSHGYFYASGSTVRGWPWYDNPETIQLVTPLFEKYDVDLVFSGHVHQMELLEKSGVTYVIAGSFGGIPDPVRTYTSSASLWYASGQYGYLDVSIDTGKAVITFRDPSGRDLKMVVIDQ
jgi:UDP-2,3-diacylglucosamine pyrophosphatase LpxH